MKIILYTVFGLMISSSLLAQNAYQLITETSSVIIKGTSSLHDWESKAEVIYGSADFIINSENELTGIAQLDFSVDVESIKSGKSVMDRKTRGALNAKKHPAITFSITDVNSITTDSIFVAGELSISGKKETVELAVAYQIDDQGLLKVTGSKKLLMTDYGIKPPKAMLGTLKTGDEIEVVFETTFGKN